MSAALSICVLFISLLQSVNGAQSLHVTLLLLSFAFASWYAVFATNLVPLASIYASL